MQVKIKVAKGKLIENKEKVKEYFSSLDDGDYIISIDRINPLVTERDYQKTYFDKIDICVSCTGNARYVIHEEFKKHAGIDSTKNLDIKSWRDLLTKLSWWAYDKFDCII
jgi:Holliday junction resolvasome RuvABC ATP-dependent DNA helicase subunit